MELLFFQRGDYAKAYTAARAGEPETYRNQYTTVDYVASLAKRYSVTTLSTGNDPHDIIVAPNLRSVRIIRERKKTGAINAALADLRPDIMVIRVPYLPILRYSTANAIPSLPCLADIFSRRAGLKGIRDWFHLRALHQAFSGDNFPCVANHSLNASRSLVAGLGLAPTRIVPWDWGRITPMTQLKMSASKRLSAFYAGIISEEKGVGDCIEAVALLKQQGVHLSLSLAGDGTVQVPLDVWKARVKAMGLDDQITFLGLIPNTDVRTQMAARDIVLVTTRSSYGEGFPNTIVEGLASRSPLVVSDHPAFEGRLIPGQDCVQFKNGNPISLAQAISHLVENPDIYAQLSRDASSAIERLNFGLEWFDLIDRFLADPGNETGWVKENALSRISP